MIKRYLARRRLRIQNRRVNALIKKSMVSMIEPMAQIKQATDAMKTVISDMRDVFKKFEEKYRQSPQPSYLRVHQGLRTWK